MKIKVLDKFRRANQIQLKRWNVVIGSPRDVFWLATMEVRPTNRNLSWCNKYLCWDSTFIYFSFLETVKVFIITRRDFKSLLQFIFKLGFFIIFFRFLSFNSSFNNLSQWKTYQLQKGKFVVVVCVVHNMQQQPSTFASVHLTLITILSYF